jgi:hypothetical protein
MIVQFVEAALRISFAGACVYICIPWFLQVFSRVNHLLLVVILSWLVVRIFLCNQILLTYVINSMMCRLIITGHSMGWLIIKFPFLQLDVLINA